MPRPSTNPPKPQHQHQTPTTTTTTRTTPPPHRQPGLHGNGRTNRQPPLRHPPHPPHGLPNHRLPPLPPQNNRLHRRTHTPRLPRPRESPRDTRLERPRGTRLPPPTAGSDHKAHDGGAETGSGGRVEGEGRAGGKMR